MLVDLINLELKNLKFYGKFLRATDIWNQGVITRRGSSIVVKHREKWASQGSLATSKLVSKKEYSRGKGHKANGLTPEILLQAIRHLFWPAPDPP